MSTLYDRWTFFGEYAQIYIDSRTSFEVQQVTDLASTLMAYGVASSSTAALTAIDTLASSLKVIECFGILVFLMLGMTSW